MPPANNRFMSILLTKRAQNTEVSIPIAKVIPKPLTGPVPNQMRIEAVIKVVRFASIIVENAFAYPPVNAFSELFPDRNSSLILSKIRIFASTAIPTVSTKAAMPGSVKVA